jgi:hypothetical protein
MKNLKLNNPNLSPINFKYYLVEDYIINNLGVPARKLAVGLSAHSPRHARKLPCLRAIRYNP